MSKRKKITVTNHAIRRYIERALGFTNVGRETVQKIAEDRREKLINSMLESYNRSKFMAVKNGYSYYINVGLVLVIEHKTRRLKTILFEREFKL